MKQLNMQLIKIFRIVLIICLLAGGATGIVTFIVGDSNHLMDKTLLTISAIGVFSVLGLCCSVLFDKGKYKPLAVAGILMSLAALTLSIVGIWHHNSIWDGWRWIITVSVLAVALTHISLLFLIHTKSLSISALRGFTSFIIVVIAGFIIYVTFYQVPNMDLFSRTLGVLAILDVLGTILTPVLSKQMKLQKKTI